jgi:hypothetical protein
MCMSACVCYMCLGVYTFERVERVGLLPLLPLTHLQELKLDTIRHN